MLPHLLFFFFLMRATANANEMCNNFVVDHHDKPYKIGHVGAVINEKSIVGMEQKLAMEMAVQDFNQSSTCLKLVLHFKNSHGKSARAASAAIDLVRHNKVGAIVGAFTLQEAAIISDFSKVTRNIPIIILNPTLSPPQLLQSQPLSIIQMSHDITIQMQCLANIISHFGWKEVTAIYEQRYSFSLDLGLVTQFSDSLKDFDAIVGNHIAFPPISSVQDPETFVHEELQKLKQKSNRVFVILQSSFDFAIILFEKAKEAGMMEKGYVWIVSDDIASHLDSIEPSLMDNMQGVIGFKTSYLEENTKSYKDFRLRFIRKYLTDYSEEEEILYPSANAFRAYDAIWAIAKSMNFSEEKKNSKELVQHILSSDFDGLSGKIGFKNGSLSHKPFFNIINVMGNTYTKIATWSPKIGLSKELTMYWPGGERTTPKGWSSGGKEKRLRIGVPAKGAFEQFVKVEYDPVKNVTSVNGFSIDVFESAVTKLGYHLRYELVPRYVSYDEIVKEVQNKSLDGAIGDITILADRYEWTEFSMPFIDSSIVMIVPAKSDITKERFTVMTAFKLETWLVIAAMNVVSAIVIYLNESSIENPDFREASFLQHISSVLWLSVTMLPFAQRQAITHNLSRLVLTVWLGVIVVVAACFTAVLSSMMTAPRLQPSVTNIEHLLKTNAKIGCNGQSFIVRYLEDVLHFKTENVNKFNSADEYPEAFENGRIAAVFLATPHSKVFLAKYCKGYIIAGPSWKFGGMGFAFQSSRLATDISKGILKITQDGTIDAFEERMILSCNCTSTPHDDPSLGLLPFSGVLFISGIVCGIVFIIATTRLVERRWSIYDSIQLLLISTRVCRWSAILLTQWFMRFGFKFFRRPIIRRTNNDRMGIIHGENIEPELIA